ncbi:MAG: hypothetical protein PHG00_01570 [Methylococcales bacterium]|nr:hypothetical protein [Methylococcales bacterium]
MKMNYNKQQKEALSAIYAAKPILEKFYTSLKASYVDTQDGINYSGLTHKTLIDKGA